MSSWVLPLIIVILGSFHWVGELGKPIHGTHYFRQSHVQSNIDKFVDDGQLLLPRTYNFDTPGFLYDFPIYQWMVTGFVQATGSPSLLASRVASGLVLLISVYLAYFLLAELGMGGWGRVVGTFLFTLSPFMLAYGVAPMVDGLACMGMLAAALCYLKLDRVENPGRRRALYAILALTTLVAALIKVTVLLPLCIAVAATTLWKCGVRFWRHKPAVLMGGASLAGLVGQQMAMEAINGDRLTPNNYASWVFGTLEDRLDPENWSVFFDRFVNEILLPLPLAFAAVGIIGMVWLSRRRGGSDSGNLFQGRRGFLLAWISGCIFYLLLCFRLHLIHDYYQWPFCFPVVAAAACGFELSVRMIRHLRREVHAAALGVAGLALMTLGGFQVRTALETLEGLEDWGDASVRREAAWIRGLTREDDFVVFLTETADDWNPGYLYYTKRDGINLGKDTLDSESMLEVAKESLESPARRVSGYKGYAFFVRSGYQAASDYLSKLGVFKVIDDKEFGKLFYARPEE